MPHGKIFMLKKLSEAFTVKYFVKYIFWVTWLKFFINITERITSVKLQIADGLLEVGLRLIYFSKTLTANQQPILWNTYFSGQLFEEQHIFPVFWHKYFWWNYVHLWIKVWEKLLFIWKKKFLMKKANCTVNVSWQEKSGFIK